MKNTKPSYSWVTRSDRQKVASAISQVYIELSTFCNLNCPSCARRSFRDFSPAHITHKMALSIASMLEKLHGLERIVFFGYGEALSNPDFRRIFGLLRIPSVRTLLITNGLLLDADTSAFLLAKGLDELYLSWDDDPEAGGFKNRQGADYNLFSSNIRHFIRLRDEAKDRRTLCGLEIVAGSHNISAIPGIIKRGADLGIDRFLVSNIFPYTSGTAELALYLRNGKKSINLKSFIRKNIKDRKLISRIHTAGLETDTHRNCPFMEKGTVFINSRGMVSPCPELAHTHSAFYMERERTHYAFHAGGISRESLTDIWEGPDFKKFRNNFLYYDFPDCTNCYDPSRCWHRGSPESKNDCYGNSTPCGECLWAKNIVICP